MAAAKPRIGLDFDNTIVCYDGIFHRAALEQDLIPADLPLNKESVRNFLRKVGREDDWTCLQGYVYGSRMSDADPFPGLLDFLRMAKEQGLQVCIISHKTKTPYRGPSYDLHAAALEWMEAQRFFDPGVGGLDRKNVYLELTKQAKLQRIGTTGCEIFIDDLPEFLSEPNFPETTKRVLFSPSNTPEHDPRWRPVQSWSEFGAFVKACYGF